MRAGPQIRKAKSPAIGHITILRPLRYAQPKLFTFLALSRRLHPGVAPWIVQLGQGFMGILARAALWTLGSSE